MELNVVAASAPTVKAIERKIPKLVPNPDRVTIADLNLGHLNT